MTDYDEIRTCCHGKGICHRCWGFIACAVDVLDHVLRGMSTFITTSNRLRSSCLLLFKTFIEQFGYTHLLWVYSGRRGIHCWISDQAAMALSDEARVALVNYLVLIQGGTGTEKRVTTRYGKSVGPAHPMVSEALGVLQESFSELVLEDQDCFKSPEGWAKLLALLPEGEGQSSFVLLYLQLY